MTQKFAMVTREDLQHFGGSGCPSRAFFTYVALIFHLRPGKHLCWPTVAELMSLTHRSRRTIFRDLDELRAAGLIKTKRKKRSMNILVRRGATDDTSWAKMCQQMALREVPPLTPRGATLDTQEVPTDGTWKREGRYKEERSRRERDPAPAPDGPAGSPKKKPTTPTPPHRTKEHEAAAKKGLTHVRGIIGFKPAQPQSSDGKNEEE